MCITKTYKQKLKLASDLIYFLRDNGYFRKLLNDDGDGYFDYKFANDRINNDMAKEIVNEGIVFINKDHYNYTIQFNNLYVIKEYRHRRLYGYVKKFDISSFKKVIIKLDRYPFNSIPDESEHFV